MEMKATFTPGPWEFSDGYITANGKPLSMVGVSIPMVVGQTRLEAIHNSRLAAAAPDLLEAAKLGLMISESWIHDQLDGTSSLDSALLSLAPVRAAIAKATETSHD